VLLTEETVKQQRPDADMHHDVSRIENVIPVGNMLNVDVIDHAAMDQPVEYVAQSPTDNETETDILQALNCRTQYQVGGYAREQSQTQKREQPPHTLSQTENPAMIANVGEVNETIDLPGLSLGEVGIYPDA